VISGAVNEIDLDLPEGGVAGFVGPNGAVQQRHHPDAVRDRTEPAQGARGKILALTTSIAAAIAATLASWCELESTSVPAAV